MWNVTSSYTPQSLGVNLHLPGVHALASFFKQNLMANSETTVNFTKFRNEVIRGNKSFVARDF